MNQTCGKIFLLALLILALGLSLNACSDSDDPVTPPPEAEGDDTDTTAPVLINIDPNAGTTGLDMNQIITAIFSETIDPATINGNITISPGTVTDLILDKNEVQIIHNPFNEGDAITVTFATGITDTAGNQLAAPISHQYWVATDEVQLLEHSPVDDSIDFPRNHRVILQFNQSMDTTSLGTAISAATSDKGDLGFTVYAAGNSSYGLRFDADLPAETLVTISIGTGCTSTSGFTLATPETFSFTTSADLDLTPPEILSFEPASGSTISAYQNTLTITFDKPLNTGSLRIIRADLNTMIAMELSDTWGAWNEDGTAITLVLGAPLPRGINLSFQFGDFRDHRGNINNSHPIWTVSVEGTPDHYPVEERLTYTFDHINYGDDPKPVNPTNSFRNAWTSTDRFRRQKMDHYTEEWNEWDNLIRTASSIELDGFREEHDGNPEDITFDKPAKVLNHPTVPATWSDDIVVTTSEGPMDVSFTAEVLAGVFDFPFNAGKNKSFAPSNLIFGEDKSTMEMFFPDCRTVVQHLEGSIEGTVAFTETDTLIYCPGFGLVSENRVETYPDEDGERYVTSKIIGINFVDDQD